MDIAIPTRRKPRTRMLARAMRVAATAIPIMLGGCSNLSLYFHNDAYEKATSDTKDAVDKLDVAAAFKSLRDDTDGLASTEDTAAITALVSLRNQHLARLIDPNKEGDWFPDSADLWTPVGRPGSSFSDSNGAAAHLEYMIRTEMNRLAAGPSAAALPSAGIEKDDLSILMNRNNDLTGARKLLAYQSLVENAETALVTIRAILVAQLTDAKIKSPSDTDCKTAKAIAGLNNPSSSLPANIVALYQAVDVQCKDITQLDSYVASFIETRQLNNNPEGLISRAARDYRAALQSQDEMKAAAVAAQTKVNELLKKIKGSADPKKAASDLADVIKEIEDGEKALPKVAGLTEVDNFLKCGLLVDLGAIQTGLSNMSGSGSGTGSSTASTTSAPTATAATGTGATPASTAATAASGSTGAGNSSTADTAKSGDTCTAIFGTVDNDKAIAGVIQAVMSAASDAQVVDKLKRIDANIMALAKLQQEVAAAQAAVDYDDKKLLLYKARLLALLNEEGLLAQALAADLALPKPELKGMADYRNESVAVRRNMGLALSAYTQSWNYGFIPAQLIDFRFVQARRQFEIQLASVTAANYKAVIQPIVDALAAYGKGGITPDTLAMIASNLGVVTGILVK